MDVGPGRGSRHRLAKGDERNPLSPQIAHERLPFGTVRVKGDVDGITMIESELRVHGGLAERADGQGMMELSDEKALDP